jgi:hypothetical protein
MPENWQPFPLVAPPNESVEEEQLDQSAATMVDWIPVVVDGKLQLMKRPGLTPWITLGTSLPIDGLHWWDKQGVVLVVSDGRVWKITDSAGTYSEITGSTALRQSSLATFADDGTKCVIANGASMVHTDLSTLTTMADADAPTGVTHVAALDGYLLANDTDTGEVSFSALRDLTNWAALDFFTAESRPDDVVAMKEGFREICAVGSESVEFWYNDGSAPFARISGSAQPFGISAPQSLALVGDTWMWLGDKRRFLTMQGRQVVPVSSPYDRVIQRYQAVSDAIGYAMHVDGIPLYVLNFPTARQTLCYNPETKLWGKWGYWDTTRAEYQRYRGQTYCYAKDWNFHLVGDYTNGIIYKAARTVFTDNTNMIRSLLRTGKVSFGTNASKEDRCFRIRCKRGLGDATTADPQIMMRQRVNNKPQWQNERWKSLGRVGQHEMLIDWRRNGIYQNVQREIIHADPTDCILVDAESDVVLLGR